MDTPTEEPAQALRFHEHDEADLGRAMLKEAEAVRRRNFLKLHNVSIRRPDYQSPNYTAIAGMRSIGRPCTKLELAEAMDVQEVTAWDSLRSLIGRDLVYIERIDGRLLYALREGYSNQCEFVL